MSALVPGLYERLLDEELSLALSAHPELSPILRKLDDEEAPHAYGQFVFQLLVQALRNRTPEERLPLVNRLIELLSSTDGLDFLRRKTLLDSPDSVLLSLHAPSALGDGPATSLPRPATPLSTSSLLTGARHDPSLEHELRQEMATADRVDILVAFIKWAGLRLLQPAFEALSARGIPVRIVTTSYMGASDPDAVAWLAAQPGFSVKVSYDTERTRLHAKAYHFFRQSGFSTGYIGSANMSRAAMTSGLEWTVKVTEVDQAHILQRFTAEFSTYWASPDFETYDPSQAQRLKDAIQYAKVGDGSNAPRFFADIRPHAFQERILEALSAARAAGEMRNLVVAATGTGKTVIAAFDYARFAARSEKLAVPATLLFVAHRKEILEQARDCFRTVLRDPNFGELWVGGERPSSSRYVFASVQSLNAAQPWATFSPDHFRFIIIDEAHHSIAETYQPLLENCRPEILLGLTATPERMDGKSILPDFGGEFAAEIRLPEALEEKLLCPFHYFGITDPVSLADERFWRNGQYDVTALTAAYTGDDIRARQRLDVIVASLRRYQPDLCRIRAVGFCASVAHAEFMAAAFNQVGLQAAVIVGETSAPERQARVADFRAGRLPFVFTVDVFSEGVDVPEINLVMFLRPTASLTVFLQQLGRGLRHHPDKDCLTVLDFIGQNHRRYRIDKKFAALLNRDRQRMDQEVEQDFPHLPPGCNIQLERVAREYILGNIRESLRNFATLVTESLATFAQDHGCPPTFGNFVRATGISPLALLKNKTWSEWQALARHAPAPTDPDLNACRQAHRRILLRTDPDQLAQIARYADPNLPLESVSDLLCEPDGVALHYVLWGKKGPDIGAANLTESLAKWRRNSSALRDLREIVDHVRRHPVFPTFPLELPFPSRLRLHAAYGSGEIKAALGLCTLEKSGPTGVGVFHAEALKCYVHLVTFRKSEQDFSPTTQYRDYPISRTQLHWESQSTVSQSSNTGQNLLNFRERGYTILFFARMEKRIEDESAPFIFLGPAERLLSVEGNRPISMVWELSHEIPAALFEEARTI
ncbi:MAG: NgoFVII family restriction endonuclease [Opitutia bacterium Tous-C1TDCM]|nr:MAG: NgoFVII family restriction endonuclease [Opitutae bacterium Tous-C1TDCM]